MGSQGLVHVLLVTFPSQGHINPLLRVGKRLASNCLLVTFSSTEFIGKQMKKSNNNITDGERMPVGDGFIRFEFFGDGLADDDLRMEEIEDYLPQLERAGKVELTKLVHKNAENERPISCIISNPFLPWVTDVANDLGIPSAVHWVQSCASFAIYYHYFHGLAKFPTKTEPEIDVHIPSLPLLKYDEVPSFLHPLNTTYTGLKTLILGQFKNLDKVFCILMDTFDELEGEIIDHMSKYCPIKAIGPLFKNPYPLSSRITGDLFASAHDCIAWLDARPPSSVVYISFGSVVYLKQKQMEELAHGVLNSGLSFLWVERGPIGEPGEEPHVLPEELIQSERGKVVGWAPQERVLTHPAVACFVTHCGWSSSMETLTLGKPVVAFPRWGDQVTNAVFLVEQFKVGVRLSRGERENRVITRDEFQRCLALVTCGDEAAEIKRNASKWKAAADAALREGGSSDMNIKILSNNCSRNHCRKGWRNRRLVRAREDGSQLSSFFLFISFVIFFWVREFISSF